MEKAGYLESASFFFAAEFKCNEAFHSRKIYIAQLFKTRAICDIIGKQVNQYWKSTVYIRYRFNRLNRAVNITDTASLVLRRVQLYCTLNHL